MNLFSYKVKDTKGKTKTGIIEGIDEHQSANDLRSQGYVVIDIKKNSLVLSPSLILSKLSTVSGQEKTSFTRMLSTMITTGLPLIDSLLNLRQTVSSTKLKDILGSVIKDLQNGSTLSDAMAKYPHIFNPLYISLVKAGEASGKLDGTLKRLSETMEKEQEFTGKVKGALIYPAIIVCAMGGVGLVMMVAVIPKISAVYKEMGASLPLPTQILITASDFMVNFWWLVLLILIGSISGFIAFNRTKQGGFLISNFMFKVPIFGSMNKEVAISLFCRILGVLIESGVSIMEALKISGYTLGNNSMKLDIDNAAKQVERGLPLSYPLKMSNNFPSIIAQMVSVGEETGTLDQSLQRLATFFEDSAERKVKGLTTALEPVMIIIMGIAVGGLAIAVLMPMFNLINVIK